MRRKSRRKLQKGFENCLDLKSNNPSDDPDYFGKELNTEYAIPSAKETAIDPPDLFPQTGMKNLVRRCFVQTLDVCFILPKAVVNTYSREGEYKG